MKEKKFGNKGLKVEPLAFESLGVRGMATYIETDDVKMIIDPGSALGPRFRLRPHEREYLALHESRQKILETAKKTDILTISHYHFDHFTPNFEDWKFIWSSPKMARELYTNKLILAKDASEKINASQRKRGYMFQKKNSEYAEEIKSADGREFEFGSTKLKFSKPLFHGSEGTKLGYVLALSVKTPENCFMHAPDIQGPMYKESLDYIIDQKPDFLILGGPPIYIRFKLDEKDLTRARENLKILAEKIPKLVVDHHLLRTTDYEKYLGPARSVAEENNHELIVASELIGKEPQLLEARRKELHEMEPVEEKWYERVEKGEIDEDQSFLEEF
ncbi:MAG: MBL fold metallo-hydrolase [Hadesarchaea archaeon]|nr:MBL fold metallo-hydrolase [Hadesarchaea archaeon]